MYVSTLFPDMICELFTEEIAIALINAPDSEVLAPSAITLIIQFEIDAPDAVNTVYFAIGDVVDFLEFIILILT
jgi:hypothetical protein